MLYRTSIAFYTLALLSFVVLYSFRSKGNYPFHLSPASYNSTYKPAEGKLLPLTFSPLPLGAIRPTPGSWLEHELQNSANGLAGHLWDFYAFVKDSSWLGGDPERGEYSALNEAFPYWFNGLLPLAYSLPNNGEVVRLKAQVHDAAQYVLDAQAEDGWFGPETQESGRRLLYGRCPFLLGLISLAEANATAWEAPITETLWRFVKLTHEMLLDGGRGFVKQGSDDILTTKEYSYGRVRVADLLLAFQWLLERGPDQEQTTMLWECMEEAYRLSLKWEAWYNEAAYIKEDLYRVSSQLTELNYAYEHGVNIAQGLKTPVVVHRFTHNASLLQTAFDAVDWTFRYHGAASGTILADERINGLSPYSGSELCTTVESIFSLVYIYHALGRNKDADHAELLAYNALPTMLTPDHWAHQYVTQPNQPWSKRLDTSPFFDTNSSSQTFGLEPHYPCCTVNHPQGLPKFLAGSWAKVGENDVAHILLGPGTVKFDSVNVECHTRYPFSETLEYTIDAEAPFSLYLRVPGWASGHVVTQDSRDISKEVVQHREKSLQEVKVSSGRTRLSYTIHSSIRVEPRANDTVAVYRGALLYALEVDYISETSPARAYNESVYPESYAPPQARNFILTNTSAWNMAIDPSTLVFSQRDEGKLADPIWAARGSPVYITGRGCEIEWPLFKEVVPGAPPRLDDRKCLKEPQMVRLAPLGSAMLHMAELPTIDLSRMTLPFGLSLWKSLVLGGIAREEHGGRKQ